MVTLMIAHDSTLATKKRGRKPLGEAALTPAERQRRRREQLRTEGEKHYLVRLNSLQQEWVEALAKAQATSETAALQHLIEASLDRYVGVMHRCERLKEMGASDEAVAEFVAKHFLPALPNIDDKEALLKD